MRWFVITGSCIVELCLLGGEGMESLVGGILIVLYILLGASAMTFFLRSRYSIVVAVMGVLITYERTGGWWRIFRE